MDKHFLCVYKNEHIDHTMIYNTVRMIQIVFYPTKGIIVLFIYSTDYTDLAMSTVTQRLSVKYTGPLSLLTYYLNQLSGDIERSDSVKDKTVLKVFKSVNVIVENKLVTIEWLSNPVTDMYADAVMTVVLQAEVDPLRQKGWLFSPYISCKI